MKVLLTEMTRLQGARDVVFTPMEDEAVLLHLTSKHYYGLNETGMRIWQLIQVGASIAEMATVISEEYEVEYGDAVQAVTDLCSELLEESLITTADSRVR